jgi:hypothetical protein
MKKLFIYLSLFGFLTGLHCQSNPDLKLARNFIDAYYVFADQKKALNFVTDQAAQQLNDEIELLKTVTGRQDAYRSRDVLFELKKQLSENNTTIFLFELTIKIPELSDRKELINIMVDHDAHKIKYFGTVR